MHKLLAIKLFFIAVFVLVEFVYFQEQLIKPEHPLHHFDHISFFAAVLSLGVILAASIYNLAFFFYIRNLQYLLYGLAQLSTFLFLINLDSLLIMPFDEIFGFKSHFSFDLTRALMQLFSLLFVYEFLKSYQVERVRSMIKVIIMITLLDMVFLLIFSYTVFTNYIPIFIPIWLILSEAYRDIKEKDAPFYFLLIGWYISIGVALVEHMGFVKMTGLVFPFLHVTLALESIFLSLAISYKFKLIEEKQKTAQALLLQQSRLASMGEMLSIIAHQWRQPLNYLSMVNMNLKRIYPEHEDGKKLLTEANKQITYMSDTIDSFRDFYNPTKEKVEFGFQEAVRDVLTIITPSLQAVDIEIKETFLHDTKVHGNKNEFEQVILNLINNAKDALILQKVQAPSIEISIDTNLLSVRDNAGGIEKENLDKIFNPYFSTKKDSDGIGLYISKMIIEQEMGGVLDVKSDNEGTIFTIKV